MKSGRSMAAAARQRSGMVLAPGSHRSAKTWGTEKGKSRAATASAGRDANFAVSSARGMGSQKISVRTLPLRTPLVAQVFLSASAPL